MEVELSWSPGHANIKGNELADQQAKEAAHFQVLGGGGCWLPVYPLLTTCKLVTSNSCRYGEFCLIYIIRHIHS